MNSGKARPTAGRAPLTAEVSAGAQGSVEILFVLAIIIILSFIVVGKFFSGQDSIFTRASAREVMVGELEKLDKKYYMVKVESVECPSAGAGSLPEIRIVFFLSPSPVTNSGGALVPDAGVDAIKTKVSELVKATTGARNKTIQIGFNRAENLVCANIFAYP